MTMHIFTEFAREANTDSNAIIDESACVTGDAQRMYRLFEEMEDGIRRCRDEGLATVGGVVEHAVFALELELEPPTSSVDQRAQDYYEQLLHLDTQHLDEKAAA